MQSSPPRIKMAGKICHLAARLASSTVTALLLDRIVSFAAIIPFLSSAYFQGAVFDAGGVVTQVVYFVNGQPIPAGIGQNWLSQWSATNLGPQTVIARAIDAKGASAIGLFTHRQP